MAVGIVEIIDGRPTLVVDGEVIPPMGICCRAYGSDEYTRGLAVDSDIKLFFVEVDSGFNDPESYDRMKKEITNILHFRPDALFMLRTWVNPSDEWLQNHTDECVSFDREDNVDVYPKAVRAVHGVRSHRIHSVASEKWMEDLEPHLENLIDRVDEEPFSERVIGYYPCALHGEEWFVPREDIMSLGWDWSPAFKTFYSSWLTQKYGNNQTLREAWKMPDVTLENPSILPVDQRKLRDTHETAKVIQPGSRMMLKGDFGSFLDPSISRAEIDLYNAFMDAVIKTICRVGRMVKEATGWKKLVGTFYSGFGTQEYTLGGTVAPLTVMQNSPDIDILAAPFNYVDRCSGGGASFHRIPIKSLHLHKKLWFTEAEVPSWRALPSLAQYYHGDKHDDVFAVLNIFKRDFASVLAADVQGWWFNNAPKTHIPGEWEQTPEDEWCNDQRIFSIFRQNQKIAREYYEMQRVQVAEAAFIYDEKSNWLCDGESIIDLLWFSETFEYPRCGFPTERLFHADLNNPDVPNYKLLVFVNCFSLDDKERKVIDDYLQRSGAVAVWLWGSGFVNPDRDPSLNLEHMREITGFEFSAETSGRLLDFSVLRDSHEIVSDIHSQFRFGRFRRPVMSGGLAIGGRHVSGRVVPLDATLGNPLFYINENEETTVMGRFLANDKPALAINKKGKSIYYGAKILNAPILREIAKFAGVHVWSESDDIMYVGGSFLSIHASQASMEDPYHPDEALKNESALKKIVLPKLGRVVDCYSGATIVENDDTILLSMKAGETRSFFYYRD